MIDERLSNLAIPIQQDADPAAAIINCLATRISSINSNRFSSFTEWQKAMQDEDQLFLTRLEADKNSLSKPPSRRSAGTSSGGRTDPGIKPDPMHSGSETL
jgi:hypothetical protein